jgi:hypothetical protein
MGSYGLRFLKGELTMTFELDIDLNLFWFDISSKARWHARRALYQATKST